jgi:DNA-binding beta-propeller fold protein YncE
MQVGVRLADGFRGEESRVISTPGVTSINNGVAVSRDGFTLLVSDHGGGSHAIHQFRMADGSRMRVIGGAGKGRLQFNGPRQVWVSSDNQVFVADYGNNRVQVLTPHFDFRAVVGAGQLQPAGVCANDAIIVVSERGHRISVFNRGDGVLLRRFGSHGSGDGQLNCPLGLCFMSGHRHIAVTTTACASSVWMASSSATSVSAPSSIPTASRALPLTSSLSLTTAAAAPLCSVPAANC